MNASHQSKKLIQKLYLAFYGRAADPHGLEFWAAQLDLADGDLSDIIDAFASSDEFLDVFGDLSPEELVNNLYQQLFGRDAEETGLDYWVDQLVSGALTLGQIAVEILNGAQNDDSTTVDNRLDVIEQFTLDVTLKNKEFDEDTSNAIKAILASVDAS